MAREIVISGDFEILIYERECEEPPINGGDGDPPATDDRPMTIIKAKAKPGKEHVILWEIWKWNKVQAKDGGPFMVLRHPILMSDRTFVSDGDNVLIINIAHRIDGGGVAYEVMSHGALVDLDKKILDGRNLFIKVGEFTSK